MKIKDGFVTQEVRGTQVMVNVSSEGFRGMVRSNKTAAFIVDQLQKETTREAVLKKMKGTYRNVSEDILSEDLDKILDTLRRIDALEE